MIKEFTSRDEFQAECAARGLTVKAEHPYREGPSAADMYDPEVAYNEHGDEVGVGSWEPGPGGDVWSGVLADDPMEFLKWSYEGEQKMVEIMSIDLSTIAKVYSGKPGCGCGCLGKYWEDERNIRRVVGLMQAMLLDDESLVKRFGSQVGLGGQGKIYYVETEKRYLWAYTKEAAE